MAEAILRHLAGDRCDVLSAGTRPAGFVHPLARAALERLDVPAAGLVSKHWSAVSDRRVDLCITVCDHASEECPIWPEETARVHWGLPDPVFLDADEAARVAFCVEVGRTLQHRLAELARLDLAGLSGDDLRSQLQAMAVRHPAPVAPSC
jgi:arsenate reductase